jgi:hypothetical protein
MALFIYKEVRNSNSLMSRMEDERKYLSNTTKIGNIYIEISKVSKSEEELKEHGQVGRVAPAYNPSTGEVEAGGL